jgi:hypothetical protein
MLELIKIMTEESRVEILREGLLKNNTKGVQVHRVFTE